MKCLLIGINAKYIHTNLAIRLLKANAYQVVDIKEFTIKDNIENIIKYIVKNNYEIVGFSCYIWNIEIIKAILGLLRKYPITIILGGPEVSYNAEYYLKNHLCDFVIKNEGEEAFRMLLEYFKGIGTLDLIPNLYTKDFFTFDKLVDLHSIKMAYDIDNDYPNRIMYIETSRGCPYHCSYCMASLDNKVRFFNIEEIKKQILFLLSKGTRIFKFLDRTFNAHKKNFLSLIHFIIENHISGTSFQFEITGDLLDFDIIDEINSYAPKGLFRFEIGIQSTNELTNRLVKRMQNNQLLFDNIKKIQDKDVIDLHLDLIAGLPKEDYISFKKTFNDVVALRPKELQLGFLKMLHGTALLQEHHLYNYKWQDVAPYEIISNDSLSAEDIKHIHYTEDAFEDYYNSGYFKKAMPKILDVISSPFDFFHDLYLFRKTKSGENLHFLFGVLYEYIKETMVEFDFICDLIIEDYLYFHKIKPQPFWEFKMPKDLKNKILIEKLEGNLIPYDKNELFKYSTVIQTNKKLFIAIFKGTHNDIYSFEIL